ncbi:GMC oxidoreductase-domain-containing protein [Mycena sp. CBHHK59/15]|nr:GMC oxidoreductase-domain-containing protein [Mycena sp. CBHHK59/15]
MWKPGRESRVKTECQLQSASDIVLANHPVGSELISVTASAWIQREDIDKSTWIPDGSRPSHFLATAAELNSTFPFNIDMNKGSPLGVGWLHSSIGNSTRSSASTAYLHPFMDRQNFHILVGTQATRLLPIRSSNGTLDFHGVEFAAGSAVQVFRKAAAKEVILSAGATCTPQLLLLSGLGNKDTLKSHGITSAVDLPDVGKRLQDHPFVPFQWLNGFVTTAQEVPSTGNYLTIALVLLSPASAGSVSLSTAFAFDSPRVDPAFLSNRVDLDVIIEGARAMKSFLAASPWKGYIVAPYVAAANTTTDIGMEQYIRQFATSIRHATGTAYASKFQDNFGVTNPDLTVKKTLGLRIVDASILPYPVSVHPRATVYGIAERGADLVKAKYGI